MKTFRSIKKEEIRDLLGKGWLTHDGSWFFETARELGIEKANKLNRAAISTMAPIEAKRLCEILGIEGKVGSFGEVEQILRRGMELILPRSIFSKFHCTIPTKNILHWEWDKGECFAYKGMGRMGLLDNYQCGVIYRIECWFKSLGIKCNSTPTIDKCLMHQKGYCHGDFEFFFGD